MCENNNCKLFAPKWLGDSFKDSHTVLENVSNSLKTIIMDAVDEKRSVQTIADLDRQFHKCVSVFWCANMTPIRNQNEKQICNCCLVARNKHLNKGPGWFSHGKRVWSSYHGDGAFKGVNVTTLCSKPTSGTAKQKTNLHGKEISQSSLEWAQMLKSFTLWT